jgi:hypothetical protein
MNQIKHGIALTRRDFFPRLGIAVGASLWHPIPSGAAPKTDAKPQLTFVKISDRYAFTCRAYDFATGNLGLNVAGGQMQVLDLKVKKLPPQHL